jgi:NADH-quinone oxidoreductase subunit L
MVPSEWLPRLLGIAVLLPLVAFVVNVLVGPALKKYAAYLSTLMICLAFVCSMTALVLAWLPHHDPAPAGHGDSEPHAAATSMIIPVADQPHHAHQEIAAYTGYWYRLGQFGSLHLDIGYYIDSLAVCMFCMVTLIASCIHFYSIGYMHDEESEYTDHEVTLSDGSYLTRPGRFPRFFQYLSLFCFSMLGLVISGNIAMTFVFWELVGICSYFLIGFYVERPSASTAANKAFIVNRVGDFGMIIGLMVIWSTLGTFNFGDITKDEPGLFSLLRPAEHQHELIVPAKMVREAASEKVAEIVQHSESLETALSEIDACTDDWRKEGYGYWLMIVAGLGIFCGCVGKSAQFPLHTWLPDAMEGPTPVSALVHSATMVAAGVFLVGRFFPVFVPEVLLVIAVVGCITLFMAATIAITATDIKRVLAYSTISQLGYMMLALGVGGWMAGMLHLFTHAFFKSLLFMCSGSVIHGVHTNEMTEMGGLRKKMPVTAYTMLIGCLAISGAGIPFLIGFSGYYSKDAILEQVFSFWRHNPENPGWGALFFLVAAGSAGITAFYMFRLWFMTFAGAPRDQERYDHAHESPKVMYIPLVILSIFAVGVAWNFFDVSLTNLLEQARPLGTAASVQGEFVQQWWPDEHLAHQEEIVKPVTLIAFGTAVTGFLLAMLFYGLRVLNAQDVQQQFHTVYRFLLNKWWFDELYDFLWVRPTLLIARLVTGIDRRWIDGLIDGLADCTKRFSQWGDRWVDQGVVDGFANLIARWTFNTGLSLRRVQTGQLRQYVMFIALGTVAIFILISLFWSRTLAG